MQRIKERLNITTLSLLGMVFIVLIIWFSEPAYVQYLTDEDGPIENLTALFYLISFCVSLLCIFKVDGTYKILPIIWMVMCLLFLGEETSWFQRIFHYSVPSVEQINAQHEFNLHNLNPQISRGWIESVKFGYLLNSQNLFRIGFFGYFLILPLFTYIPNIKIILEKIGYQKPETGFVAVLIVVFFISFSLAFFASPITRSALAETREMFYAVFIMVNIFAYMWTSSNIKSPEGAKKTLSAF